MTYDQMKNTVTSLGYQWYDGMGMLNIVGERIDYNDDNTFKDIIHVAYISQVGERCCVEAEITTLPGWYYLQNPMNPSGTAIVKPGQYVDVYKIGNHYNQIALVLDGDITVYRDGNKDTTLDLNKTETGNFAINIHHADGITQTVDRWSAGCQVYKDTTKHQFLMFLASEQIRLAQHDRFTYTLIMSEDIKS